MRGGVEERMRGEEEERRCFVSGASSWVQAGCGRTFSVRQKQHGECVRASPSVRARVLIRFVEVQIPPSVRPSVTLPRAGRARCIAMNANARLGSAGAKTCTSAVQKARSLPSDGRLSRGWWSFASFPTGQEDPDVDFHHGVSMNQATSFPSK